MKKKNLLLTCMLTASLAFGITACATNSTDSGSTSGFTAPQTSEQSYAFSAISAANIITAMGGGQTSASAVKASLTASAVTDSATIASLDEYMGLVESILSGGGYNAANGASDRAEYTVMTTLSFADMSGETIQYVMYYNEINVTENTKTEGFETETERRSQIEGVLVIDGADYAIHGVTESETEGKESEWETRFTVTLSDSFYILITQESEEDGGESEVEYEYSLYENGSLVKRSAFSYEQEKGETEIEMSVTENGVTNKFYFEKETERGVEYIVIKIGSASSNEKYRVTITENADGTNAYSYEYIGK